MRRLLIITTAYAAAALIPVSATLGGPPVTSPLTPPPPSFEACSTVGGGTICQGTVSESYGPVDTGLVCGNGPSAFDIFDSATHHELARRVYDASGNLVRRVRYDRFAGQLSNQSTGAIVAYTQAQTTTDVLSVPGDLGSATETLTGEFI